MNRLRKSGGDASGNSVPFGSYAITPEMRRNTVRDFAITVFGKETTASAWMGRACPAVLDGDCIVSTACLTEDGFRDAMIELHRLQQERLSSMGK